MKNDNYNDIDELVKLLLQYTYNNNAVQETPVIMTAKDITVDNILRRDFSLEDQKKIMGGVFKEMGVFNDQVYLKRYSSSDTSNPTTFILKKCTNDCEKVNSESNMNKSMRYVLDCLVLAKVTNNIILSIINFNCKKKDLGNALEFYKEKEDDLVSVEVVEHYYKIENLSSFINKIKNNREDMRFLFFQILLVLSKIQQYYQSFKHGKLNPESMQVYIKENVAQQNFDGYEIKGITNNFIVKLVDFTYSNINGVLDNDYYKEKPKKNHTIDFHYFIDCVMKNYEIKDPELNFFMNYILDDSGDDAKRTPEYLLTKNDFFKSYHPFVESARTTEYDNSTESYGKNIRVTKKKNQKGGDDETKVVQGNKFNTPFAPYRPPEQPKEEKKEIPPLFSMTMHQEPLEKFKPKEIIRYAPPLTMPIPNPYYPMANPYNPAPYDMNYNMPVQKTYNISMGGPTGEHVKMANLYEKILPVKDWNLAMTTMSERILILSYIRSTFANLKDGDDISLGNDSGKTSLLSYIRFIELNGGSYRALTNNPYKLPEGFLIYDACYPLRYDKGIVKCAKNSMGIKIRIYRLTSIEYMKYMTKEEEQYMGFDVWRELTYYEYIKENVIKPKICPHFSLLYCFFISRNNGVNFQKLQKTRESKLTKELDKAFKKNDKEIMIAKKYIINNNPDATERDKVIESLIRKIIYYNFPKMDPAKSRRLETSQFFKNIVYNFINKKSITLEDQKMIDKDFYLKEILKFLIYELTHEKNKDQYVSVGATKEKEIEIPINIVKTLYDDYKYSNNCLIALTEAFNKNLYVWASAVSIPQGTIIKEVETGVHSAKVWKSVFYQIMVGLYVLQLHGIYFPNFSVENNIFIKDLNVSSQTNGYWIYIINGIEYYVPNYGYLVLIDSSFADIDPVSSKSIKEKREEMKIEAPFMDINIIKKDIAGDATKQTDIITFIGAKKDLIYGIFKRIFSPAFFSNDKIKNSVTKPPQDIIAFLGTIVDDPATKEIDHYIMIHMSQYLHNKVGTPVTQADVTLVDETLIDYSGFKKGELVVYKEMGGGSRWNIFLKYDTGNPNLADIYGKENAGDTILKKYQVGITRLRSIVKGGVLEQTFKLGQKFSQDELIETYVINKL